jgi:hypothetical protein
VGIDGPRLTGVPCIDIGGEDSGIEGIRDEEGYAGIDGPGLTEAS